MEWGTKAGAAVTGNVKALIDYAGYVVEDILSLAGHF